MEKLKSIEEIYILHGLKLYRQYLYKNYEINKNENLKSHLDAVDWLAHRINGEKTKIYIEEERI